MNSMNGWINGLPPAGVACEMLRRVHPDAVWQEVTFLCAGKKKVFFRDKDGDEWSWPLSDVHVRPIRTPEQIAADARLHEIRNALTTIKAGRSFPNDLVRGNITVSVVEAMIDAGYRKQEVK